MRAAGAVDELEVDVDRLAVPAEADGHFRIAHLVEVERLVALLAGRPGDDRAGHRRDVDLGFDPGDRDLRDLGDLGGQRALLDQEHVGGEPGALVHGLDVGDDARHLHRWLARKLAARHHHVVELQVLLRADRHRELERRRRDRAHH